MKKCNYMIMTCHIQWIVGLLWILLILPTTNGYIINQDGHLVPYKVYKKGSYQIHPRNCRGGSRYRKRASVETLAPSSDKLYELDVFKRKLDQRTNSDLLQALDSENGVYAHANEKPLDRSREKSHDADLREFQKLAEKQLAYDILQQRQGNGLNSDDKMEAVYDNSNNNHAEEESELFKQMLSRNDNSANSATDYHYKGIADPPTPDRRIGAILEEFPLYEALEELLATYNKHSGVNSDIFDPSEDLSLYEIQKRR